MRVLQSMVMMCALGLGSAYAQHDEPADSPNAESPQETSAETQKKAPKSKMDIETIRTRLEYSIKKGEVQLERNREALRRLGNGESPVAVLRAVRMRNPRQRPPREEDQKPRQRPNADDQSERVGRLNAFFAEHLPEMHEQLKLLAKMDEASANRLTLRLAPKIEEIMRTYARNETLGQLKIDELRAGLIFVETMRQYRSVMKDPQATADQQKSAMDKLRLAAETRFDAKMKLREYEITKLTEQLLSLSKAMSELRESRDAEIDQMITASQSSARHRDHKHRTNKGED